MPDGPLRALEDRIRREFSVLGDEQIGELTRVVQCLVDFFHPERVYVFGSHARGEATPESDIDLLIVIQTPTSRLIAWLKPPTMPFLRTRSRSISS